MCFYLFAEFHENLVKKESMQIYSTKIKRRRKKIVKSIIGKLKSSSDHAHTNLTHLEQSRANYHARIIVCFSLFV